MTSLTSRFKCNNNSIVNHRGTISLVGNEVNQKGFSRYVDFILQLNNRAKGKALSVDVDEINNNRRKRDGDHYHITLISKKEVATAQKILQKRPRKKTPSAPLKEEAAGKESCVDEESCFAWGLKSWKFQSDCKFKEIERNSP